MRWGFAVRRPSECRTPATRAAQTRGAPAVARGPRRGMAPGRADIGRSLPDVLRTSKSGRSGPPTGLGVVTAQHEQQTTTAAATTTSSSACDHARVLRCQRLRRAPTPTVSIIVPAKDEARTIEHVLARARGPAVAARVIVVDDGSTDGTAAIAKRTGGGGLRGSARPPTGARARRSARASRRPAGDIVVIQDADLEYDPGDLPELMDPLLAGRRGRRLRLAAARGQAAAGASVLALPGQSLSLADDQRALQHDDQRHGGRLQGVPRRARPLDRAGVGRLRASSPRSPRGLRRAACACTRCRSRTTAARTTEGKKIAWRDGIHAVGALIRYRVLS